MYIQIITIFSFFWFNFLNAQTSNDVTFNDVKSIIDSKCIKCHNLNKNAPFSLLSYNDVISKSLMIKKVVQDRVMPPILFDTNFRQYENIVPLSNEEILKISNWIDNTTENEEYLLEESKIKKKKFKNVKNIYFKKINNLGLTNKDQYLYRVLDLPIKDSVIISNYNFVIKNKFLHHTELLDLKNIEKNVKKFNLYTPVYELHNPAIYIDRYLIGWFPGSTGGVFPINTGLKLYGDKKYLLIKHYSPTFEKHNDKTFLEIEVINNTQNYREVLEHGIYGTANFIKNNPDVSFLKANVISEHQAYDTILNDLSVFAVYFHAHHLCKDMIAYAITPENDTINLLKIDQWNFNWQFTYRFKSYIKIPKGSILYCKAKYDNTNNNIENPFSPPQDIKASFNANDEMFEFFLLYLNYLPNDERELIKYNN